MSFSEWKKSMIDSSLLKYVKDPSGFLELLTFIDDSAYSEKTKTDLSKHISSLLVNKALVQKNDKISSYPLHCGLCGNSYILQKEIVTLLSKIWYHTGHIQTINKKWFSVYTVEKLTLPDYPPIHVLETKEWISHGYSIGSYFRKYPNHIFYIPEINDVDKLFIDQCFRYMKQNPSRGFIIGTIDEEKTYYFEEYIVWDFSCTYFSSEIKWKKDLEVVLGENGFKVDNDFIKTPVGEHITKIPLHNLVYWIIKEHSNSIILNNNSSLNTISTHLIQTIASNNF